jgi:hypothetical protein
MTTGASTGSGIRGDRALQAGDEDRLGFRQIAARIAIALVDHASDDGLVIGIDGAWGTGKSSLLFLIEEELGKLDAKHRPTVVNFRPWLVGQRDALLADLFGTLATQINKVAAEAGDATGISIEKAKAAAEALRKFTDRLGRVGSLVEFAGDASGIKSVGWIGKGLKALGGAAGKKFANQPLPELKENLVRSLKDLGHRFIVTIDDVDRLEPSEVIEVLRLVRSVADFPNVIYLLCYDSDILAHSIKEAAKVKSGHAYLEKIVQLTIMVPTPEAFELRQWFTDDLHAIATPKNDDELSRLRSVIDYEGGRLVKTPRAVVRGLDAIRFFWPPLRDAGGDLADLVWLQLIKDANPALYRWIELYSAEATVLSLGTGTIGEADKAQQLDKLLKVAGERFFTDSMYRFYFAEHLPGVEADLADGGTFELFQRDGEDVRSAAIRDRRLASPDHYRLYFALAAPAHTVTGFTADEISAAAEAGGAEIGQILVDLHKQRIGTSPMGQADVLLERFKAADVALSPNQAKNLLLAFSDVMDDALRARPFDVVWMSSLWDRAERLVPILLAKLDPQQRSDALTAMFTQGGAISWLSKLFRRETFAHGRFGERQKPKQDWIFSDAELDQVAVTMLQRYQALTRDDLWTLVDPLDVLFAWSQGGDADGPKKLIAAGIADDEGLVTTLEKLTTFVTSSNRGTYSVLKFSNLGSFLDYDEAHDRTRALAIGGGALAERAQALAIAFEAAAED